jgi:predicted RNase H-like HicB family nuclease
MRFAIVIEKGKRNYSAYVPDVPGCVAAAKTLAEVKKLIKSALEFHFEGMMLDNEPIPEATSECGYVSVDFAKIGKRVRRESQVSPA